jgi:hypothetical protein
VLDVSISGIVEFGRQRFSAEIIWPRTKILIEMGRQETKQEFLLCMRKVPLGWVDRHLQKINAVCMEGKRRSAHLSMMWELGAYKHWKFDETMKSWARVVLDEKKRALHELGWKNHQKNINRTIQFWTRTVQIYASYKVQVTPNLQLHFFQTF